MPRLSRMSTARSSDWHFSKMAEISPGVYELAGSVPLPEAADFLGFPVDEDEADTIAGYVVSNLARMPKRGDQVRIGEYQATVLHVMRHRIARLRFDRQPETQDAE